MSLGFVLAILISGFFTGALARLAIPGPDPMPIWLTIAIGLAGSIAGAVFGKAISNDNGYVISFTSFGVAIALVAILVPAARAMRLDPVVALREE